jgi:hypothetical protein
MLTQSKNLDRITKQWSFEVQCKIFSPSPDPRLREKYLLQYDAILQIGSFLLNITQTINTIPHQLPIGHIFDPQPHLTIDSSINDIGSIRQQLNKLGCLKMVTSIYHISASFTVNHSLSSEDRHLWQRRFPEGFYTVSLSQELPSDLHQKLSQEFSDRLQFFNHSPFLHLGYLALAWESNDTGLLAPSGPSSKSLPLRPSTPRSDQPQTRRSPPVYVVEENYHQAHPSIPSFRSALNTPSSRQPSTSSSLGSTLSSPQLAVAIPDPKIKQLTSIVHEQYQRIQAQESKLQLIQSDQSQQQRHQAIINRRLNTALEVQAKKQKQLEASISSIQTELPKQVFEFMSQALAKMIPAQPTSEAISDHSPASSPEAGSTGSMDLNES